MGARPDFDIPVQEVQQLLSVADRLAPSERSAVFEPAAAGRTTIDLVSFFRLMRRVARATGEETFALSRRPLMVGSTGFIVSIAQSARTLGEALRQIARGYNLLHGGDYVAVEQRGYRITLLIRDERYPYTRPHDDYLHFAMECALIGVHGIVCELAQQDLTASVSRVATRRPRPEGLGANALGFWEAPVGFGGEAYAISYDVHAAGLPIRPIEGGLPLEIAVDNRVVALIEARNARSQETAAGGVGAAVRRALADGLFDQRPIARRIGLSVATLRRRLAEEGLEFRALRAQAMSAYASARLMQTAQIAQVGEELGFSDPRAFTRAFKAWTGHTPSDWRRSRAP